jgi:hypothetical protein
LDAVLPGNWGHDAFDLVNRIGCHAATSYATQCIIKLGEIKAFSKQTPSSNPAPQINKDKTFLKQATLNFQFPNALDFPPAEAPDYSRSALAGSLAGSR